jgi:hypothetical protein
MRLNDFYHESFKKWLKGKCSHQSKSVDNLFEKNGIEAQYKPIQQLFIIYPSKKQYSLKQVEETIYNEEEFNSLIQKMLKN